jgi:hypothetical protein
VDLGFSHFQLEKYVKVAGAVGALPPRASKTADFRHGARFQNR